MASDRDNPYASPAITSELALPAEGPSFLIVAAKAVGAGLVAYLAYTALRTVIHVVFRGLPLSEIEGLWLATLITGAELLTVPIFQLDRSFLRRVLLSAAGVIIILIAGLAVEGWIATGHERGMTTDEVTAWLSILWWSALPLHLLVMISLRCLLVAMSPGPEAGKEEHADPP